MEDNLKNMGFKYNANYDYNIHPTIEISKMDILCIHCGALKLKNESRGMCCGNGKVKIPLLRRAIGPLLSSLSGETPNSKHFLKNIREYNSTF